MKIKTCKDCGIEIKKRDRCSECKIKNIGNSISIKEFRVPARIDSIICKAANEMCMKKGEMVKLLINNAAIQLEQKALKAGGYDSLTFGVVEVNGK